MPTIPPTNIKNPNDEALFDSSTDSMNSMIIDVTIIPSAKPKGMTYTTIAT